MLLLRICLDYGWVPFTFFVDTYTWFTIPVPERHFFCTYTIYTLSLQKDNVDAFNKILFL